MYITRKIFIKPEMRLSDLFIENPYLMLMIEHFNLNEIVTNKTVKEICSDNGINYYMFLDIANFYNGFNEVSLDSYSIDDIHVLVNFLKNTHNYYKDEKIPEIKNLINRISQINHTPEIKLIKKFFDDYHQEVIEHLDYEDQVAFPNFIEIVENLNKQKNKNSTYSSKIYSEHHTDIEYKLMELRNLLLKHIPIHNDKAIRRRLIISLFELEYDLKIHYFLEELILIPLISNYEKQN